MNITAKIVGCATLITLVAGCVTEPLYPEKSRQPPGPVQILDGGWVKWVSAQANEAPAYFIVQNPTMYTDVLISASSPRAASVEMRRAANVAGVRSSSKVAAIPVEGATRLDLRPDSYYLLLSGLTAPLQEGEKISLTLKFKRSGAVETSLPVMMMYGGDPRP